MVRTEALRIWRRPAYFLQGWLLLIGFLAVVIGSGILLAPRSIVAYLSLVIPLTLAFVWIASKTTRGGWRWRGGDEQ